MTKENELARAVIGLVGKLPAAADFLRVNAGSETFQSLLGTMIDAVQGAAVARGSDWLAQVPRAAVQAMCYRGRLGTSVLGGAIAPSCDQVGRRFPIVAASELALDAELTEHAEVLPLVLESVWAATSQLVLELHQLDRAGLDALPLELEVEATVREALAAYRCWTDEHELDDFIELVFASDRGRAAAAMALVEETVKPYHGVENPETPLSLRLPLGQAGGAAVCFWLDLIERLSGWYRTVPSFFWSHDGDSGALLVHLGRVPPVALSELWLPTGNCDEVCDLILPAQLWSTRGVSRWERIIGGSDQSVSDLLRAAAVRA
jgi:type VI secretion system ImpM family protein